MTNNQKFIDAIEECQDALIDGDISFSTGNTTNDRRMGTTIQRALEIAELVAGGGGEELLPCPFCGGEVILEQPIHAKEKGSKDWWGIVCRNTLNLGGSCAIEQRASRTKEAAIIRWNTRHNPAQALIDGWGE